MRILVLSILFFGVTIVSSTGQDPVRIGVAGLSHSHVLPLLRNLDREDIQIVGIAEGNSELAHRYADQYGIHKDLLFGTLEEMLEKTEPEGVITFTSIFDHLKVVEACAPRGIHIMVEKPLAVSTEHARAIWALAEKHGVQVLTNYETTWYPAIYEVYNLIRKGAIGDLRKVVVYDGHKGPKEINVNPEFLEWLTDPVLNGGGAVTDFGCYGADLLTWMLKGQKPTTVFASLKQYKPDVYPRVDDDATIVLSYPTMEGVLHASWNWPFSRKDMHVYGSTGYIFQDDARTVRYRLEDGSDEQLKQVTDSGTPYPDGFAYFAAVIRGEAEVESTDLSSLEINMTVVEILEAAIESSNTGKRVKIEK